MTALSGPGTDQLVVHEDVRRRRFVDHLLVVVEQTDYQEQTERPP
jgi:hypothetical protein